MQEVVKKFIAKKEHEKREKLEKEKNEFLEKHELYEKEFSNSSDYDPLFPYTYYDEKTGVYSNYRIVNIKLTDEEYEELKKYDEDKGIVNSNTIAIILRVLAVVVILVGSITGISYMDRSITEDLGWICMIASWVSGIFILGFAEIIQLLHKILQKIDK